MATGTYYSDKKQYKMAFVGIEDKTGDSEIINISVLYQNWR